MKVFSMRKDGRSKSPVPNAPVTQGSMFRSRQFADETRTKQPLWSVSSNQPGGSLPSTRSFGWEAVSSAARVVAQRKLTLGAEGDIYEQEADRIAARVAAGLSGDGSKLYPSTRTIQRLANNSGLTRVPSSLEAGVARARAGGQSLAPTIRGRMEQALGRDLSGVRLHTDARSDQLNQSFQSRAFTTGQHIFFQHGAFAPDSRTGCELLAHELVHVIQQSGMPIESGESRQDPSVGPTLPASCDACMGSEIVQRALTVTVLQTPYELHEERVFLNLVNRLKSHLDKKDRAVLEPIRTAMKNYIEKEDLEENPDLDFVNQLKGFQETIRAIDDALGDKPTFDTSNLQIVGWDFNFVLEQLGKAVKAAPRAQKPVIAEVVGQLEIVNSGKAELSKQLEMQAFEMLQKYCAPTLERIASKVLKGKDGNESTAAEFTAKVLPPKNKTPPLGRPQKTLRDLLESLGMGGETSGGAHGLEYDQVKVNLDKKEFPVHLTFFPGNKLEMPINARNWSEIFDGLHVTIERYGKDHKDNPRCYWSASSGGWKKWEKLEGMEGNKIAKDQIMTAIQSPIIKAIKDKL